MPPSPRPAPARQAPCAGPWPDPRRPPSPARGTRSRRAASRRHAAPPGPRCGAGPRRNPLPRGRHAGRPWSQNVPGPSPRAQDPLGEPPDDLTAHVARVEQHKVVDDHAVLQIAQPVDQLGGVRAPSADDGHLGAHAAQRNIRPCPRPPLRAGRARPSTGAARRPTSSSCRARQRPRPGPGRSEQPSARRHRRHGRGAGRGRRRRRWPTRGCAADRARSARPGVYCLAGVDLPVDEEKLAPAIERHGVDRAGHPAQRHLRRVAGGHHRRPGASASSAARG